MNVGDPSAGKTVSCRIAGGLTRRARRSPLIGRGDALTETAVILNPNSGNETGVEQVRAWADRHRAITLHETADTGDGEAIARRAIDQGATMLVAAGGDGTINEVINGMADALDRVRLGIVPVGTGNDLARAAGVPLDTDEALGLLAAPEATPVDLLRVTWKQQSQQRSGEQTREQMSEQSHEQTSEQSRLMANVATAGLTRVIRRNLTRRLKAGLGPAAYIVAAVRGIRQIEPFALRVWVDDEPVVERPCTMIAVANGRSAGGGAVVAPDAAINDGLLDVIAFHAQTIGEQISLLTDYWRDALDESLWATVRRGRKVHVDAQPEQQFSSDGELFPVTAATFEVMPGALQLVANTAADDAVGFKS